MIASPISRTVSSSVDIVNCHSRCSASECWVESVFSIGGSSFTSTGARLPREPSSR